jgi:hypothetical protein
MEVGSYFRFLSDGLPVEEPTSTEADQSSMKRVGLPRTVGNQPTKVTSIEAHDTLSNVMKRAVFVNDQ